VRFVLNLLYVEKLGTTPLQALTGQTQDISILLAFSFWEPVYYATADKLGYSSSVSFPSGMTEGKGRFVGFGKSMGDALTFKILTDDTCKVIYRSAVCSASATTASSPANLRLDVIEGEPKAWPASHKHINSGDYMYSTVKPNPNYYSTTSLPIPNRTTSSNVGNYPTKQYGSTDIQSDNDASADADNTVMTDTDTNDDNSHGGDDYIAPTISTVINKANACMAEDGLDYNAVDGEYGGDSDVESNDELMRGNIKGYNEVLDHMQDKMDEANNDISPEDKMWRFTKILAHEGPLKPHMPNYMGSDYNVLVQWEDGSKMFKPLKIIVQDDPITCAEYAQAHGLMEKRGWKRLKHVVRNKHRLERLSNYNKRFDNSPRFKFGIQLPRSVKEAYELDKKNGNTKWADAITLQVAQQLDYKTFKVMPKGTAVPQGYKHIKLHFVFDVKHDGCHKACLVAGGHLTDEPDDSVYSSVVLLRDLQLVIFAGELNGLDTWGADVGNAYLESYTKENVCVIAGPEFGELE
jgi:hypothetical protein